MLLGSFEDPEVRKAKRAKGGVLEALKHRSQLPTEARPARDHVVIGAEDHCTLNDPDRQLREELPQLMAGVNTDVGGEPVAYGGGEVIYQRDVAVAVPASPIHSVRFQRVAAIGYEQHKTPARIFSGGRAESTDHFCHRGSIVIHMFDDLV